MLRNICLSIIKLSYYTYCYLLNKENNQETILRRYMYIYTGFESYIERLSLIRNMCYILHVTKLISKLYVTYTYSLQFIIFNCELCVHIYTYLRFKLIRNLDPLFLKSNFQIMVLLITN